jgi:hypothetical protein
LYRYLKRDGYGARPRANQHRQRLKHFGVRFTLNDLHEGRGLFTLSAFAKGRCFHGLEIFPRRRLTRISVSSRDSQSHGAIGSFAFNSWQFIFPIFSQFFIDACAPACQNRFPNYGKRWSTAM